MNFRAYAGLAIGVLSRLVLATGFRLFEALDGLAVDFYMLYPSTLQTVFFASYALFSCEKEDLTRRLYDEKFLHLARGVTGFFCFYSLSVALQLIPASDTSAILKSTPVFVSVLAFVLLKERFGVARVFVLLLTVAGVVLVCRPTFLFESTGAVDSGDRLTGTLCTVAACLILSFIYIIQRKIRRTPVAVTSLANAFVTMVLALPVVLIRSSWETAVCSHAVVMFLGSSCILVGLILKFQASRLEEASRLALVSVVDLPFTLMAEIAFFGIQPPWTSYAGSAVIVLSLVLVILLKRRETAAQKTVRQTETRQENPAENDTLV